MSDRIVKGYQSAEYGKFLELSSNSNFPPVSVVRWSYPDTTSAFPGNSAALPLSSVDIYPKYAVLTHIANPEDISVSLSASNINVNLSDVENLITESNRIVGSTNTKLNTLSANITDGIGGYPGNSQGWYTVGRHLYAYQQQLSSVNSLLSSMDITLKNGLNVTGTGSSNTKKVASTTLISNFITPSANNVYNVFGISTASVGQYLQIYDIAGTTPTGTPDAIFFVPANTNFNFEFANGFPLTNKKAVIVNSLTPIAYNAGNSDLFLTVIYN